MENDGNLKLTSIGCLLTLLTVALIFGVAIPIVQWRDPDTGQPLPRLIAISLPVIAGAVFYGGASFLLNLIGLPVMVQRKSDDEPRP
jgi:hypothetical protein